jgi:hypothetical protein
LQQTTRKAALRRMVAQSRSQTKEKRRSKLIQTNPMAGINQNLRDRLGKDGVAKY